MAIETNFEKIKYNLEQVEYYAGEEVKHRIAGFGFGALCVGGIAAVVIGATIQPTITENYQTGRFISEFLKPMLCVYGGFASIIGMIKSVSSVTHANRDGDEVKRYFEMIKICLGGEILKTEKKEETKEIPSQDGTIEGKVNELGDKK